MAASKEEASKEAASKENVWKEAASDQDRNFIKILIKFYHNFDKILYVFGTVIEISIQLSKF